MSKKQKCKICDLEYFVDLMLNAPRLSQRRYFEKIVLAKRERLSKLTHLNYLHCCSPEHYENGKLIRREYLQSLRTNIQAKKKALSIAQSRLLETQLKHGELSILKGAQHIETRRMEYEVKRLRILVAQRKRRLDEANAAK